MRWMIANRGRAVNVEATSASTRLVVRALCPVGDGGVLAATWAFFFPPTRPRKVNRFQGDTPRLRRAGLRNPRQRGLTPSAKGGQVCALPLLMVDIAALAEIRERTC